MCYIIKCQMSEFLMPCHSSAWRTLRVNGFFPPGVKIKISFTNLMIHTGGKTLFQALEPLVSPCCTASHFIVVYVHPRSSEHGGWNLLPGAVR